MPKTPASAAQLPLSELVLVFCKGPCSEGRLARLSRDPDAADPDAPPSSGSRHIGFVATCLACGVVARDARDWVPLRPWLTPKPA